MSTSIRFLLLIAFLAGPRPAFSGTIDGGGGVDHSRCGDTPMQHGRRAQNENDATKDSSLGVRNADCTPQVDENWNRAREGVSDE